MSIRVWRRLAALFLAVLFVGLSPAWAAAQTRQPAARSAAADTAAIGTSPAAVDAFVAAQM